MLTIINASLDTAKQVIGLAKELKPIFRFISGKCSPNDSQVRAFKLFSYSLLCIIFFMGGLSAITVMLIHLPTVGGFLNLDIIYKVSNAADYFMKTLILTGYLIVFTIANIIFIYMSYQFLKTLVNKIRR